MGAGQDTSTSRQLDIGVIGGGLAGMSAAEALVRNFGNRIKVTIYEARRVTGGRAGSFIDLESDESVDYCQHVAMACCTNLLSLMDRCCLQDAFRRYAELTFLHPLCPPSQFAPSTRLPAPLHLARVLGEMRFLDSDQRSQIRRAMVRLLRSSESSLRGQFAGDWLRQRKQSETTIDEFWGTFVVSALGEEIEHVDMSAVRKLMVDGFCSSNGASDVLVPEVPLSELFGERLPATLKGLGVDFCTGQVVGRIEREGDRVSIPIGRGQVAVADHVISSVPWHAIGKILPDDPALDPIRSCESIPSSPITGVHLWLDREITEQPHVALVGTLAQWLFRPPWRESIEEDGQHYYQVVISASSKWRSMPKQELIERVMKDLQLVSSEAQSSQVIRYRVVTDPHSVFSVRPEVVAARPSARTALPWFHLAGDWIDTGWPATMEGAVISGRMAANSIASCQGWNSVDVDSGLPPSWLAKCLIRS